MGNGLPKKQGLYNPENEHDNCGIGFVTQLKGVKSHDIVQKGLEVLVNMTHRGAESADNVSGDGAGILIQVPHDFIVSKGIKVPTPGKYGTGLIFLPRNDKDRKACEKILIDTIVEEGLDVIEFNDVTVDNSVLGEISRETEPVVKQIYVTSNQPMEQQFLERKLYMVRKMTERKVRESKIKSKEAFYIPSLSSKVMIYKGMLTPEQVGQYFVDLRSEKLTSAIALVHSRFSTNTFPTWDLAQPFRLLAHNGEINTVKGNRNWMHAREGLMKSELFGDDLQKLFPVIEPDKSDSASLDNALEFLVMTGRSLPHALSMLIPESWNDKNPIPQSLKAFYEYHSTFMEPWDGPASIVFSDGRFIGGTLDRNGLRPSRYIVTNDDMIVMGSEVGVQSFEGKNIKEKGRLRPGKILLVDTKLGIIVPDYDVKQQLTNRQPYFNWLKENRVDLEDIVVKERVPSSLGEDYDKFLKVFGYAKEDLEMLIKPMAIDGQEPVSSMGNDTPLAVMSSKPQRLFNYFKQLFAQVTNPAIDPIREGLVMALTNYIGSVSKNILLESSDHCKLIKFKSPIVTNTDLQKIKDFKPDFFTHETIQMTFDPAGGGKSLEMALEKISEQAEKAVDNNVNYIILSDRNISKDMAPIPSLLATAAIHHHLIKAKKRMQVGLIVETADAREVTHFALLIGFGASVVNPYMAFAVIDNLCKSGEIQLEYGDARENYIKSINKGLLKILSKYGISTLRSYHGAQIFECLGINPSVVDKYFTGTDSRIGGIGLEEIAKEAAVPHSAAYDDSNKAQKNLKTTGFYHYRKDGETHAWNPETVGLLQWATRANDYSKYKEFSAISDDYVKKPIYLRGCLNFKNGKSIPIEEVEPAENIMKRFVTGAMSFGSISKEAHESLAIAMNTIGGKSNTGEGGEDPERFKMRADGTLARSAIKQVASGRFGVTTNYLVNADEIQIKVAQGAKPGEGGQLPGHKVDKIIAKIRNSTPGITLISPPPHHDIYSIEDLAQLIFDLKCSNPKAKINVKLVAAKGVGTIAAGVAKAYADSITIAGSEGGTGASPASSIKHAGLPMELGIAEAQQTLVMNNLRDRVVLQTDGQMKTGRDVVIAGMLGAEEFGFATAALITLGCIMMRKCHLNTCPVGVATQNAELRKRFTGKHEYVINYFRFVAEEIREYLAELGYKKFDDIIGRADLLETRKDVEHWKAKLVDLSNLTYVPKEASKNPIHCVCLQKHKISDVMDHELIKLSNRAIKNKEKVWISKEITNVDRTVGAMLSGEIAKVYGEAGLPENTINCKFTGSAGQSFGAFLVRGVTFTLIGESNDYLGKGLSGGRIIVSPPKDAAYVPEENIIIGNTVLYGATGGELYVRGVAGERFCVRNSGAVAVIEGVGDHCCEYMTGGRTVVLGQTGRNFAAGMSGGIAYVLDMEGNFDYYCNQGLVELGPVGDRDDINELQQLISNHYNYTGSELAERILTSWEEYLPRFVKVIPFEYKKVLEELKLENIKNKIKHTEDEPHFHY